MIGRRRSSRHPERSIEEDGTRRLALDQRVRPAMSQRHVAVTHENGWLVRFLPDVVSPACIRMWGELVWHEVSAGTTLAIAPGRPLAIRHHSDQDDHGHNQHLRQSEDQ